jgi:hypothetical protein
VDPHAFEESEHEEREAGGSGRRFGDFDCPVCSANNPYDEKFGDGDEIRCYYCGQEFRVRITDSGSLRLREI